MTSRAFEEEMLLLAFRKASKAHRMKLLEIALLILQETLKEKHD